VECLWNVLSKDYKNRNKKKDAWQEMSFHIGVDVVEKKMKSLLAQYWRERKKGADAKKSGSGADGNGLLIKGSQFVTESTSQEKPKNRK
jgi:hypothetical protein